MFSKQLDNLFGLAPQPKIHGNDGQSEGRRGRLGQTDGEERCCWRLRAGGGHRVGTGISGSKALLA